MEDWTDITQLGCAADYKKIPNKAKYTIQKVEEKSGNFYSG